MDYKEQRPARVISESQHCCIIVHFPRADGCNIKQWRELGIQGNIHSDCFQPWFCLRSKHPVLGTEGLAFMIPACFCVFLWKSLHDQCALDIHLREHNTYFLSKITCKLAEQWEKKISGTWSYQDYNCKFLVLLTAF